MKSVLHLPQPIKVFAPRVFLFLNIKIYCSEVASEETVDCILEEIKRLEALAETMRPILEMIASREGILEDLRFNVEHEINYSHNIAHSEHLKPRSKNLEQRDSPSLDGCSEKKKLGTGQRKSFQKFRNA